MENKFELLPYLLIFVRKRNLVIINFILIIIVAGFFAFVITKKQFKADIVFLPPVSENSLGSSLLQGMMLPSMSSSDIMPEQIETIFKSKALKKRIIDQFRLSDHYEIKPPNQFIRTEKALQKDLLFSKEETGAMTYSTTISFSLVAYHSSPDTAYQIVNFSFRLLDSAVRAISSNRAYRNRVFIEGQLEKNMQCMDSLQKAMQLFQMKNKAYNISEQTKLSVAAYAETKAALRMYELRISALKTAFSEETPELIELRKKSDIYKQKLSQIETKENPDAQPSFQNAVKLFPQYTNLLRDIEVENQIILFLTRELEQAKIKEAKNISSLVITDPAFIPDYKARPKRMTILAIWVFSYMVFFCSFLVFKEFYRKNIVPSKTFSLFKDAWNRKK